MHWNITTPWLALLLLSSTSTAQVKSPTGSLERARRTFAAVDADGDHPLTFAELEKAGLSRKSFNRFDADLSTTWSEADFLLYYKHLLKSGGKRVDAAFELEVARIRARRNPDRQSKPVTAKTETKRPTLEKAELAKPLPEKPAPTQPTAKKPVAPLRKGQPAPPVVLDPGAVPTPKDGRTVSDPEREAYEKAEREREAARAAGNSGSAQKSGEDKNLLERAKEAQRRKKELSKPSGETKRTEG